MEMTDQRNRKASEPEDRPCSPSLGVALMVDELSLIVKTDRWPLLDVCHQLLAGSQTDIFPEQLVDIIAEQ